MLLSYQMDLKDRYLNNKTTKYMLRADRSVYTLRCSSYADLVCMYARIVISSKATHYCTLQVHVLEGIGGSTTAHCCAATVVLLVFSILLALLTSFDAFVTVCCLMLLQRITECHKLRAR
jgi:hypothetical protein